MEQQSIFVVQCLSYNAFNKLLYKFQSGKLTTRLTWQTVETLRYEQTEDTYIFPHCTYEIIYNWEFFKMYINDN
jgi:hypothetical protein